MKIDLTKDELQIIITSLILEEGVYKFRRGFGKAGPEEIGINKLINKITKAVKK